MEVPQGDKMKGTVCLYEGIGSMFLLLAINLSASSGHGATVISIFIFAAIILFGGISGAHFNPAVTTGVFVYLPEKGKNAPFYALILLSQILGATIGVMLSVLCAYSMQITDPFTGFKQNFGTVGIAELCPLELADANPITNHNSGGQSIPNLTHCKAAYPGKPILVEAIGTFIFVTLILNVKFRNGHSDIMNSLAVSLALYGCIGITKESGSALNPAVGMVQTIF